MKEKPSKNKKLPITYSFLIYHYLCKTKIGSDCLLLREVSPKLIIGFSRGERINCLDGIELSWQCKLRTWQVRFRFESCSFKMPLAGILPSEWVGGQLLNIPSTRWWTQDSEMSVAFVRVEPEPAWQSQTGGFHQFCKSRAQLSWRGLQFWERDALELV